MMHSLTIAEPATAAQLVRAGLLQIGAGCRLHPTVVFLAADLLGTPRPILLGEGVTVGAYAVLHGGLTVGAHAYIGHHAILGEPEYGYAVREVHSGAGATTILGADTIIRAGAIVYAGTTIGDKTTIGHHTQVLGAVLDIRAAGPAKVAGATGDQGDDPMRRRTVLATVPAGLLIRLDHALAAPGQPTTAAQQLGVAAQYRRARQLFDAGQLTQLIDAMPDLLATAHADTATHDATAYFRLTACYTLASETLNKAGAHEASRLTADRAMIFADLAESPLSRTVAARALGIVLRHQGDHALADEVALNAAVALEATGLPTPEHAGTYALALCTCAYNAATAGRRDAATSLMDEAKRAAAGLTVATRSGHPFALTGAQVTLYQLGIHWALGDAGAGLHAARDLRPEHFPTPERRARLHTDRARAWAQWAKPAETARALLNAHSEAPAEVRNRPSIRGLAKDLIRNHPATSEVRLLAATLAR